MKTYTNGLAQHISSPRRGVNSILYEKGVECNLRFFLNYVNK